MWNIKYDTNGLIYENRNKLTDIETVVDKLRGGARGGGMNLKFGISRIKLLCIEQINNKVLL